MEPQTTTANWGTVSASRANAWLRAMRPWQWLKNLLVFVPLVAAHSIAIGDWFSALIAFVTLSLAASAMYLINDVVDVEHDRRHPGKCRRPFAAGQMSLSAALWLSVVLVLMASALAMLVSTALLWALWLYCAAALGYSLRVRQIAVVDVMLLTALYLLRVIIGGVAAGIVISFWMFAFLGALFLSLSLLKRCTELTQMQAWGTGEDSARPYGFADLQFLQTTGIGCGIASAVVLALYIGSPEATGLYSSPAWLWGVLAAQLLWVLNAWFLTVKGAMHDDPVVHAASHPGSLLLILSCLACLTLAM